MSTPRETVLAALFARLQPPAALVLRDEVLPDRIPLAGLIILRYGPQGELEVTLSPLRYHYQQRPSSKWSCRREPAGPSLLTT